MGQSGQWLVTAIEKVGGRNRKKNSLFVVTTMCSLFLEIYKSGLSSVGTATRCLLWSTVKGSVL
jgi:hypothetical protein